MSEILFLAHRLPFPPDRGDKIRSHHVLKALARIAPVHVGCFAETEADRAARGELEALAASACVPDRTKPLPLAGAEALLRGEPVSLAAFRHHRLTAWVKRVLEQRDIGAIYVFSGQMGQYVPRGWQGRVVMDLVDVDSAKFEAYAQARRAPMRWIDAREGRLLRREEQRLVELADAALLVSAEEAALLRERLPAGLHRKVSALGNGIDAGLFDPAEVSPHPALAEAPGPHLVFTGQMNYPPNEAAAERAIRHILPAIRRSFPQAQFHIVGRRASAALRAHDGRGGVRVWGEVPDVKPFLAAADLVTAPLGIARGVQNKVLEAMAMQCAVLLTPGAATGIAARDGEHFAVAQDDAALSARALELLDDPAGRQAMGRAARRFVLDRMSWPAMLAGLPDLLGPCGRGEARDAA